jgi:O-antigen ligase
MRRPENSPAPRPPERSAQRSAARAARRAARAAGAFVGTTSAATAGWVDDSKYQTLMTLMICALLFYMTVPVNAFEPQTAATVPEPNLLYRTIKVSLLAAGTGLLVWRFSFAMQLAREVNRFFIAFLLLIVLSATWSIEPAITLTRCLAMLTISLVCGGCVMVGWHDRRFQEIVRSFFTLLMVASLIYGIVAPDLAKEQGTGISLQGAWRGVLGQKNGLGHAASIAVFFWVHAYLTREVKIWKFLLGCGVSVACLVLSRSSASLLSATFSVLLLLLLLRAPKGKRRYMAFIIAVFVTTIMLYSLAVLNIFPGLDFLLQPIVSITGKDLTFSGRTQIWAVIRQHISAQPLLGSGYGAYWIGPVPTSPSYVFLTRTSNFYPTEAHNGYLDVLNDLGYVGLVCLLGYVLVFLRQSLGMLKINYVQATLYLALLFEEMINNLTESEWLSSTSFSFAIMTFATFALARSALDQRLIASGAPAVVAPSPRPGVARQDAGRKSALRRDSSSRVP